MGASVGIGGLVIGVSMLVVFSMAYQSITLQIESGLDRIEEADEPVPTFAIDDATLWEGAVVALDVVSAGSGYSAGGTLVASSGTGGFEGTYTVDAVSGAVTSVVITSHGNYSARPTVVVSGGGSPTSTATFDAWLGNFIYANLTNTGSTTIPHSNMWMFIDGASPVEFSTVYTSSIASTNWYSGETLSLEWSNVSGTDPTRLSISAGENSMGAQLV